MVAPSSTSHSWLTRETRERQLCPATSGRLLSVRWGAGVFACDSHREIAFAAACQRLDAEVPRVRQSPPRSRRVALLQLLRTSKNNRKVLQFANRMWNVNVTYELAARLAELADCEIRVFPWLSVDITA